MSKSLNLPLLKELLIRDVSARYKGAALGLVWLVLVPTLTLLIYVVLFKYIFKARCDGIDANFHVIIFSGMTFFGMLGDVISRAPTIIAANQNYIKKVVFPVSLLPVVVVCSSLVSFLITYVVLLIFTAISDGVGFGSVAALIIIPPYFIMLLGISMLISAIGVFYKDLQHFSGFLSMLLMYSSPVFYSISAIPIEYRKYAYINPLTLPLELFRGVYFGGEIDWGDYAIFFIISISFFLLGKFVFFKVKGAFADEL